MANEEESVNVEVDKFDIRVAVDLMMTLGTLIEDTSVSDKDFRTIMKDKVKAVNFLVENGVVRGGMSEAALMEIIREEDYYD
jgi:acetylglutamate kinase